MTIAVAIPTIGRPSLFATISSLARQTRAPDELIIVNQGEPDLEPEVRKLWPGEVSFVQQYAAKGLSRSRNGALQVFQSDWIYWIDDDEEANAENLEQLEKLAGAFPEAAFFGGIYLAPLVMESDHYCDELYASGEIKLTKETWCNTSTPGEIYDVWGGNAAYRRDLIDAVGQYDEFLGAGTALFPRGEDTDYNARAITLGFEGVLTPRLVIYHTFGARKRSGDEPLHAIQSSAVLSWKAQKDSKAVDPVLADRFQVFGRKKQLLSKLTGGMLYGEHGRSEKVRSEILAQLDRDFSLRDGRLVKRATL